MAKAEIGRDNSGQTKILVDITFREKNLIKQVPGAKYDHELSQWKLPLTYASAVQLSNVFGKSIEVSDDLVTFAREEYDTALMLGSIKSKEYEPLEVLGGTLMPLQHQGVQFLCTSGNAILGDDMGSGKTVQTCVTLNMNVEDGVTLIVCPKSVKKTWERHIEQWTNITPFIIEGGAATRRKQIMAAVDLSQTDPVALIMNWDQLKEHSRLKHYGNVRLSEKERTPKELNDIDFNYVIADEAHRAKSPKSKWTRALWQLGQQAQRRIALTGTPIANHPGEFWSLLHFVDPDEWPSRGAYIDRYCVTMFSPWGGSTIVGLQHGTRDEFYHLIDRYFLRRTKEEVMERTIEVVPEIRVVTLPPKQRKMYNSMRDELIARIEEGLVSATNPLVATARLVQLCGAPLLQGDDDKDGNPTFRMVAPSPKVDEMMNIITEDLAEESVIIFSSSKQLLTLAREAIDKHNGLKKNEANPIHYSFVTGDVTGDDRDYEIDKFQNEQTRVFLGMTSAVGEGVTLTAARYMVYLQRSWSMIQNRQSEDRNNRIGQEADQITIIDIVAEDTIDERIYEVFGSKKMRMEEITRDNIKEML
jgi:SNF2 family DNA or RNA helicase